MYKVTICYIGGGSGEWAVKLMRDLALEPELEGELRLFDIDLEAAKVNEELGRQLFSRRDVGGRFTVTLFDSLPKALDGANIVILSIEPGPTECRYADLEIPQSYGIIQTVGDTTGPGGILRAWRAIPLFREFGETIQRYAPEAWILNYTNPMTLCVAAIYAAFPEAKCVGCCHEVPHMKEYLTEFFAARFDEPNLRAGDIDTDVTGINHFTFATRIRWEGRDLLKELEAAAEEAEYLGDLSSRAQRRREERSWFESDHRVALEFLRRFGAYGFAGDRHLVEFVPWFLHSEEELHRYGVIRTPYWWRKEKNENRRRRNPRAEAEMELTPSGEEGIAIIRALVGGTEATTNVNLPNRGQISWLPGGHPVETYATVTTDSIKPRTPASPPESVQGLVRRAATVQQLSLQASLDRDRKGLFEAVLLDPLVTLPVRRAERMVGEMISYIEDLWAERPEERPC